MSANIPRPSVDENISTTLSSGITDVATSIDVADASKIVAPCYLVIDRVDSAGTAKATSLWEYVKVTNVASNTLTVTRGQGGSTGQAHGSGAVIEAVVTSSMFEDWYNALNPEHTAAGGHIISTATITTHLSLSGASISGLTEAGITTADNTTNDVSTTKHGFVPKAPNDTTKVFRGDATWAVPATHGVRVYKSADQTIAHNTATLVTFDSEVEDTDAYHDTGSNTSRLTVPAGLGGRYRISFHAYWANAASPTGRRLAEILKNGAVVTGGTMEVHASANIGLSLTMTMTLNLVATDYIELRAYQTQGDNLAIFGGTDGTDTVLEMYWIGA